MTLENKSFLNSVPLSVSSFLETPFDLDELEMKVCRLVDRNKYEDDLPEHQDALQAQNSNSNLGSYNSEKMTGIGFDPNNYRPIPPVGNAASQQGAALPTLTPKPVVGADFEYFGPYPQ